MVEIDEKYWKITESNYSTFLYYGGRSSGKSYGVADTIISLSCLCKIKVVVCRETRQSMEKSILALYKSRIETHNLNDIFNITKEIIVNKETGSQIIFIGVNDSQEKFIDSVRSIPDIDILILEEAQSISELALKVLVPTVRRNIKGSKIVAIWNPNTIHDPIWNFVINPRPRTLIQKVNYLDNSFCPPETIEEANYYKESKPDEYNNVWLGEPRDLAANLVTKYFNLDNICELKYIDSIPLHISCDFNSSAPMSWIIAHKDDSKVYFIDEIVIKNATTADAIKEFIKRYPNHKGEIIINGDASGDYRRPESNMTNYAQIKFLLKKHGYKNIKICLRNGNPKIKQRIAAWNNKILNLQNERCIFITNKCKWLLYNIYNLAWKEGIEQINLPSHIQIKNNYELDYLGHIFDAASYLIEYYWPVLEYKLEEK